MSTPAPPAVPDAADPAAAPVRRFGRFGLRRLLGKSERTMAWRVADPRRGHDLVLVLPRRQPPDAGAVERWLSTVRRAARVQHPNLAPVIDTGVVDGWPWLAHDAPTGALLAERLDADGQPGVDVASWAVEVLEGLAFAHDAGLAHHDVQPYLVQLDDQGHAQLMGLEATEADAGQPGRGAAALDAEALAMQRSAARRDVLALALVLHQALVGSPALGQADSGRLIDHALPPAGRDLVRLPWTTTHPIPEPLRAIVNRATDRQPRHRYRNARTLARALDGWLRAEAEGEGVVALLLERLHSVGLLPAAPGAAERVARLALMERERTGELAEIVLQDLALSFELLRMVNTAQVRGVQVAGNGPVLTVRRAIAMLGLDGVRRGALALRPWPGGATEAQAPALRAAMARAHRAARAAQSLRPAGYDAEVVGLVTLLQRLGPLALQYHFPDEAAQIQRLTQPQPAARAGEPDDPGLDDAAASYAVLGTSVESLGIAIARHWGLDASVLQMLRRLPTGAPVRSADHDDDVLRAVASCANEAVDALACPAGRVAGALQRVAGRYARTLGIDVSDVRSALQLAPPDSPAPPPPPPPPTPSVRLAQDTVPGEA
ncbi:MAG: HDOD domain-containing protein [Rubrivivax sp.]